MERRQGRCSIPGKSPGDGDYLQSVLQAAYRQAAWPGKGSRMLSDARLSQSIYMYQEGTKGI